MSVVGVALTLIRNRGPLKGGAAHETAARPRASSTTAVKAVGAVIKLRSATYDCRRSMRSILRVG
jgi:hypothetical protein